MSSPFLTLILTPTLTLTLTLTLPDRYANTKVGPAVVFSTTTGFLKVWKIKGMTEYFELAVGEINRLNAAHYEGTAFMVDTARVCAATTVAIFSDAALHIKVLTACEKAEIFFEDSNQSDEDDSLESDIMMLRSGFKVSASHIVDGAQDAIVGARSQRLFLLCNGGVMLKVFAMHPVAAEFWRERRRAIEGTEGEAQKRNDDDDGYLFSITLPFQERKVSC